MYDSGEQVYLKIFIENGLIYREWGARIIFRSIGGPAKIN